MSEFVWIIPVERLSALGSGGVSPRYVVPSGQMHGQEYQLRERRLWIVLRGLDNRCIATMIVKNVERFSEGYYESDFLISCDTMRSFRLASDFDSAANFKMDGVSDLGFGVHSIPSAMVSSLKQQIVSGIQTKLIAPSEAAINQLRFQSDFISGSGLARAALSTITQSLSLDKVWASGRGVNYGPFSQFAIQLLLRHGHGDSVIADFLLRNDPVYYLINTTSSSAVDRPVILDLSPERSVDLDFTEIDPQTVFAREFVFAAGSTLDIRGALKKTEVAEKVHQDMVRDISAFLKSAGVLPYESSSVDLMFTYGHSTRIFEIKSATQENIVAQAAKGAFQIACYSNAMATEYQPLKASLILNKVEEPLLEQFVHRALDHLGVAHLTYDPEKPWPERVGGLLV